ncbi:MAG: transporter [Saprospiraceae bacterium]|nr:transporter [Saprospiraceae bacterium]
MSKNNSETVIKERFAEDSGFGSSFSGTDERVLNVDGTFNLKRIGSGSVSIFHEILQLSWGKMLLLITVFYILINFIFAIIYYLIGADGLSGIREGSPVSIFMQCYFFSVQSFTTVGYGGMHPVGMGSSILAGIEALCGLLTFAIITGLVYSKFSKPNFKFKFSDNLLFAPYKDIKGAMFRVVNSHRQTLVDVEATMIFSHIPEGHKSRIFRTLELEIKKISLFPLSWTINHPITEQSPMYQLSEEKMTRNKAEIIILLSAYDEESGRVLKEINSYHFSQFVYNAKFSPMVEIKNGKTYLYLDKISEFIQVH